MLVQCDRNELGDARLNDVESVAREREKCLSLAAQKRIAGQDELEDPMRAFGPRLQHSEFIARLKRIIPALKVVDGSPGNVALYFPRNRKEFAEAEESWTADKDFFFLKYKYVGGFPKEELQEYGTVDIDNARLATKEHRAWRTVLINLIEQGVVSYNVVKKEFGDTGSDKRGWRWRELLQGYKN